jgi:hypothetical protein
MSKQKKPREEQPEERDYSEYEFDASITEYEGFTIGDQIEVIEEDPGQMYYEGETGQVVGFSVIPPASDPAMAVAFGNDPNGGTRIYVVMDGTDEPIDIKPEHMEVE